MGLSYDPIFISFFCWYMGEPFWSCKFFFINLPLKLFNFNFMSFFLKIILILNLEEKKLAGQEKKIYSDLTFSQYNHIQNVEEKQLFQHFANLIKIRSAHLFPIFYLFFGPRVRRSNYTLAPRRGTGVYCFTSVCPSFQDIFRRIFLSNY